MLSGAQSPLKELHLGTTEIDAHSRARSAQYATVATISRFRRGLNFEYRISSETGSESSLSSPFSRSGSCDGPEPLWGGYDGSKGVMASVAGVSGSRPVELTVISGLRAGRQLA